MVWIVNIILLALGIVVGVLIVVVLLHLMSPYPSASLIKVIFDRPYPIGDAVGLAKASEQVDVITDTHYPSKYRRNKLDIYTPTQHISPTPVPVMIWVHGGGFVGGNKSQLKEFGTLLASQSQIAVVTINYDLAPHSAYPQQLKQLDEAYRYLLEDKMLGEKLDFSQLMFGGDSAGAQIAAQYLAVQTNANYAREMSMEQLVNPADLKGFVSYCGPLDLKQMLTLPTKQLIVSFLYTTIARSLIGTRKWQERPELKQASVVDFVTHDFPASFITDGNTYSFETQGQVFVERLTQLNVPVTPLFFTDNSKKVIHEYQFLYDTQEGQLCLSQTIAFIQECLN